MWVSKGMCGRHIVREGPRTLPLLYSGETYGAMPCEAARSGAFCQDETFGTFRYVNQAAFGVSARAASKAFSMAAMVSSVSSPMLEMRKVFPLSLP